MRVLSLKSAGLVSLSALAIAAAPAQALELQAGNTTLQIGGYIKLDAIYNVDQDLGDTAFFRGIDVGADNDGTDVTGKTRFHANETRLSVGTRTPTAHGPVRSYIETDFFGGGGNEVVSNSSGLRLRHAFLEWNGILAGQTWSNFMPMVFAPTLDFGGPAGYIFNRQAQVRYTFPGADAGRFSVSLENPESNVVTSLDNGTRSAGDSNDPFPDVTLRFAGNAGGWVYSLSGVVTQLEVDDGNNSDRTSGFGVNAAGSYSFGGTRLGGQVGYYDGANRYLWQNGTGFFNGYVDDSGDIETVSDFGLMLFLDQALSPRVNGGLVFGFVDTDSDAASEQAAGIADDKLYTAHANLRYRPVEQLMYGVELQWGQRELRDGSDANATRVQFAARLDF
ncbi:hypothetical protein J2T57_003582 [Natronocella acetinitrilica]|uniref:Porin n=1 Tax=Natronocella acetinitrilica TaxID=414046 RepID=A0AAE3G7V2_9GAMM|nr:DcaP family trimeric outer membrane transporter [Natronocella acetinitrilica]MCP1676421.1 hypothetical protein [Natronocella acetinitrilica]